MNEISFPGSPALWAGSFTLKLRKEKKNRQVLRLPAELPAVMEGYRRGGRFLGKQG